MVRLARRWRTRTIIANVAEVVFPFGKGVFSLQLVYICGNIIGNPVAETSYSASIVV